MSVLVKGMKMPETCRDCPFCCSYSDTDNDELKNWGHCTVTGLEADLDDACGECWGCPLVEIPDMQTTVNQYGSNCVCIHNSDYIGRQQAIVALQDTINDPACPIFVAAEVEQILSQLPAAEVKPVVRGKWIDDGSGCVVCSECGEEHEWGMFRANFCDNCGADMREEEQNGR